jgi:serine/threonine protein kinase
MITNTKGKELQFLRKSYLEEEYSFLRFQKLPRLGDVSILQNKEGHQIMVKEKTPTSEEDCLRDVQQANERMKLNHPHLLKMLDYASEHTDNEFRIKGYYEMCEGNLLTEIENRREHGSYFEAEELRNLLIDTLEVVTFLKDHKMIHGDVRPEYIIVDSETQIYKLADRLGDPSPPTKVQARNIKKRRNLYMSPQLFYNLVNQIKEAPAFEPVKLNPYMSEGYSIGMVVLEAGLLDEVQSIYDLRTGKVENSIIAQKFAVFENRYEEIDVGLVRAVQDLLEISEDERPDLHMLLTGLKCTRMF